MKQRPFTKSAPSSDPKLTQKKEICIAGFGIGQGLVMGVAHVISTSKMHIPDYRISPDLIETEQARLDQASADAWFQVRRLRQKTRTLASLEAKEINLLLDVHASMLRDSRLLREAKRLIADEQMNAQAAVDAASRKIQTVFQTFDDRYLAGRVEDVREATLRIQNSLHKMGAPITDIILEPRKSETTKQNEDVDTSLSVEWDSVLTVNQDQLQASVILIAESFTPSDVALMDSTKILGFASMTGGIYEHAAILSRSRGLTAVIGAPGLALFDRVPMIANGDHVLLDGLKGQVIIHPCSKRLAEINTRKQISALDYRPSVSNSAVSNSAVSNSAVSNSAVSNLNKTEAVTQDGSLIRLEANLEFPSEVALALGNGAAGIGLLRTEFHFLNHHRLPDVEEQTSLLVAVIELMKGRPVTLRTLDSGGDKLPHLKDLRPETNPALGLRAIRLGLKRPDILEPQLAAMLRASACGPVRILLPMITHPGEIIAVRASLERIAERLHQTGIALPTSLPPLGVMIETPAAAMVADGLAAEADFFAIGTNDLIQYTLAIDRMDDQVASLYDPLHPGVLRLIDFTVQAAEQASISVSVCGEIAGDPSFTQLLVGLGVRELSMVPALIPAIKTQIRNFTIKQATEIAQAALRETSSKKIAALLAK